MILQLLSGGFFKIIICIFGWFCQTKLAHERISVKHRKILSNSAVCQCNYLCLTEHSLILTEKHWIYFDRTTCLTENLDEFAFDRNANGENVLSKNTLSQLLPWMILKVRFVLNLLT